jgi:uncharacterized surface protein with fasciclin (FAS1) repeats
VFAPTDDAFADLPDELEAEVGALLGLENLEDILLYHVTEDCRYEASVVNAPE